MKRFDKTTPMFVMILACVLICAISKTVAQDNVLAQGECKSKVEYDEKEDTTGIIVDMQLIDEKDNKLRLIVDYSVKGKKITIPSFGLSFGFASNSQGCRYKGEKSVREVFNLYLDGTEYKIGAMRMSSQINSDGRCDELLFLMFGYNDFVQMLNAKEIKGQLGQTRFRIKEEYLEALRDMKRCIEQAAK